MSHTQNISGESVDEFVTMLLYLHNLSNPSALVKAVKLPGEYHTPAESGNGSSPDD